MPMQLHRLGLILIVLAGPTLAAPFPNGNPKTGKELVEKNKCNACHVTMVGGDGTQLYTRSDRKVKSSSALLTQIRFCASQLGTKWFPEEEEHVAAYLNQIYYKFK